MKWPLETESSGAMPGFDNELDGHLALEDFQGVLPKRASFARYLAAICVGIVGTLAWQSCGEAIRQTPATTASELGWLPQSNLAKWVQQFGWTKQQADFVNAAVWLPTSETSQPPPVAQVVTETLDDAAQRQLIAVSLATLRQTVEQMAAGQDKMASEINRLAADVEVLSKIPAHPPQPPARKPMPAPPPRSPRSPPPLTLHP
jgi:hypothetical protein